MTVTISRVTNSQYFGTWLERTNQIAQLFSQNVVTGDSSAAGSLTTGNVRVNGYFTTNTLAVGNQLRGGNNQSNGVLTILANVAIVDTLGVDVIAATANSSDVKVTVTANAAFQGVNVHARHTITANNVAANLIVATTSVTVGNSSVNVAINSTAFSGTAANAQLLNGKSEAALNVNNATTAGSAATATDATNALNANNAAFLGGLAAAGYANASSPIISTQITVGNSSVNVVINSTSITVGPSVLINTSTVFVGNSTQNVSISTGGVLLVNGAPVSGGGGSTNAQSLSISSGVINWNVSAGRVANVTLTSNNANVAAPTGLANGDFLTFEMYQDGTGTRVINDWDDIWQFPGGVKPPHTTTASRKDVVTGVYNGAKILASWINDMRAP